MTVHSLAPAFVQINWHSMYAPHRMVIPTLQWEAVIGSPTYGGYNAFDSSVINADTMIEALVDTLAPLMPNTTFFDDFVIYLKEDADSPNLPVRSKVLGVPGTGAGAAIPAAMQTWSFRTAIFGRFKLVMTDLVCATNFLPTLPAALTAEQQDVVDILADEGNAWCGRDRGRINQIIRITAKISDELRKQYRIS